MSNKLSKPTFMIAALIGGLALFIAGFIIALEVRSAEGTFGGLNGKIAFTRSGGIYVMNSDGSGVTQLSLAGDTEPTWSPDGRQLAFSRNQRDVFKMLQNGSGQTQLTFVDAFATGLGSWSPDGAKIAFYSPFEGGAGNEEIYVMNADGTAVTRLTNLAGNDRDPKWSPDGTKIMFEQGAFAATEIYVMNSDGTNLVNLTNNPAVERTPDWSPDGTKIAFASNRDGNHEIYVMNANGSGQTRLTNSAFADDHPVWSPDGAKIAFESNRDGNYEIYVMDPDGSGQTRLTNSAGDDTQPDWQPVSGPVGGIGELPDVAGTGDGLSRNHVIIAAVSAMIAFGAGAFYARKRWSR
jgi:Tol biopolymer transport system component